MVQVRRYCGPYLYEIGNGMIKEYCGPYLFQFDEKKYRRYCGQYLYEFDGNSITRGNEVIRHSVNAVYMIVKVFFITMFTLYLCSMMSLRNKVSRGWRFVVYFPMLPMMIVSILASVSACKMGLGMMEARRLPVVLYTFYLSLSYYQLLTLWVGVRYAGVQEKHSVLHVMAANFLMTLTMAIQQGFPYVRIAPFIASVGLLDILFTVLRPDEVF